MGVSWPTLRKDPKFIDVFETESTIAILFASFYFDSMFYTLHEHLFTSSMCSVWYLYCTMVFLHRGIFASWYFASWYFAPWYFCIVVLLHHGIIASWYYCTCNLCAKRPCRSKKRFIIFRWHKPIFHIPEKIEKNRQYHKRDFQQLVTTRAKNGYPVYG